MSKPLRQLAVTVSLVAGLAACSSSQKVLETRDAAPANPRDVSHVQNAVPRAEPRSRYGNPESYVVYGKRYYTLASSRGYRETGGASWYGTKFHGRRTSSGEPYDMYAMTAAHKTLPLPSYVEVTNLANGRKVVVRVNDRGPFHDGRIIDMSYAGAVKLGMLGKGTAHVEVRTIEPGAPAAKPVTMQADAKPVPASPQPARATAQPAATPVPVQAAATPSRSHTAPVFLQVGAFSNLVNAERLRTRLEQGLARRVRVTPASSTRGPVHRVQVGPLASVEIADQVSARMLEFGINTPLVVID